MSLINSYIQVSENIRHSCLLYTLIIHYLESLFFGDPILNLFLVKSVWNGLSDII